MFDSMKTAVPRGISVQRVGLAERAKAAGVAAEIKVYPIVPYVWQITQGFLRRHVNRSRQLRPFSAGIVLTLNTNALSDPDMIVRN
jgi:hypothetical protein